MAYWIGVFGVTLLILLLFVVRFSIRLPRLDSIDRKLRLLMEYHGIKDDEADRLEAEAEKKTPLMRIN